MKHLIVAVATLLTTASFAQSKKFTFKLGSEYELPRKSEDLSFFGNEKDGIVNLSLKKEELSIVKFNGKTLEQSDEKVIELPEATKNFNSEIQPVILKVAHSQRESKLFWYVDNVYKGSTITFHEMPISATTGFHYITVVDEFGNEIRRKIEIVK